MPKFIWWSLLVVILLGIAGFVGTIFFSEQVPWFIPYEVLGTAATVDTEAKSSKVEVEFKHIGYAPHKGPRPRLRLHAQSDAGSATCVYDPDHWWGAHVSSMRPVPGGVDVLVTFDRVRKMAIGTRFLIQKDEFVSIPDIYGTVLRTPDWLPGAAGARPDLLAKIQAVGRLESLEFDPVALIQAVNALQAAGQDEAVSALRAYLPPRGEKDFRSDRELDNVHLILRMLFVPRDPGKPIPPLLKGVAPEDIPNDLRRIHPDYPLVTIRGVPFLLGPKQGRYVYEGSAEDPLEHLDFCLQHADFRKDPWVPQSDPLRAGELLLQSEIRDLVEEEPLRLQILFALGRVLPCTTDDMGILGGWSQKDKSINRDSFWRERVDALRQQDPVWDSSWQDFVSRRFAGKR